MFDHINQIHMKPVVDFNVTLATNVLEMQVCKLPYNIVCLFIAYALKHRIEYWYKIFWHYFVPYSSVVVVLTSTASMDKILMLYNVVLRWKAFLWKMCHNTYVYMVYHRLIYGVVSMVFYVSNLTTTHCQHIVRSLAVFFRGLKLTLEYIFKSALSRILYQYSLWVFYITPFILILY